MHRLRCRVLISVCVSVCVGGCVVQVKFFVDQYGAPIRRFSTPVSEFKEIERFIVQMLDQRDALYNGTMKPIIPSAIDSELE